MATITNLFEDACRRVSGLLPHRGGRVLVGNARHGSWNMSGKVISASYHGEWNSAEHLGKMRYRGFAMRNLSPARLIAAWVAAGLLVFGATAEANPFARFFYSIRHPHHQRSTSHRHKRVSETCPVPARKPPQFGPSRRNKIRLNRLPRRVARGSTHPGKTKKVIDSCPLAFP